MKLASDAGLNEKAFAEALQSPDTASLASSLGAACRYQSLHSLDKAEVFQTLDFSHWVPSMLMIPTLGLMELLLAGEYIQLQIVSASCRHSVKQTSAMFWQSGSGVRWHSCTDKDATGLIVLMQPLPARSGLGLAAGKSAVVSNGRVIALEGLEALVAEDFRLLDQYANTAQVAKQVKATKSGRPFFHTACCTSHPEALSLWCIEVHCALSTEILFLEKRT